MEEEFSGLVPSLKNGSVFGYNPQDFKLSDLEELFKKSQPKREFLWFTNDYGVAIMNNNKEQIAIIEKRMRVDRFRKLKSLIKKWGLFKAKIIAWLNKKDSNASFMHPDTWSLHDYGKWEYKGVGKGESDSVTLRIFLKEDKFKIVVYANDCDGYCADIYEKTLSENISFKSIINQINYFSKKLKQNNF